MKISTSKFAPVAPLRILRQLKDSESRGLIPPYLLVLAHDVAANPDEWVGYYASNRQDHGQGRRYDYSYQQVTILDNSICELGGKIAPDEMIFTAAEAVLPDVIVLPDVFHDPKGTFELAMAAEPRWDRVRKSLPKYAAFMYVLQGNNFEEYLRALDDAIAIGAEWVSVPRNAVSKCGSRQELVKAVHCLAPHLKIHLLGFSEKPIDDIITASLPGVMGIDSAVPMRMASAGIGLSTTTLMDFDEPRGDWWETAEECPLMAQNYARIVKWLQG